MTKAAISIGALAEIGRLVTGSSMTGTAVLHISEQRAVSFQEAAACNRFRFGVDGGPAGGIKWARRDVLDLKVVRE